MIRVLVILFGAYVGSICPAPTVALVLLLTLSAMCIGLGIERAKRTQGEA